MCFPARLPSPFLVLFLFLMVAQGRAADRHADFYLSPAGNDAWSGKLAEPNAEKTDGPLATLDAARLKVRTIDKAKRILALDNATHPVVVAIGAGTYFLTQPITFTPEDGGDAAAPIVYQALANEEPIFSGGVQITGWKSDANGRWVAHLDDVQSGKWDFNQLFVNGQRRMRPRLLKTGYQHIAGRVPSDDPKSRKGDDRFRFAGDDIRTDWKNVEDVEVITFHPWFTSMMRIAEVNPQDRVVTFTGGTRTTSAWGHLTGEMRYLVENVGEALREAGEWYLDRPTGTLTYIPLPGESIDKAVVIAPRLPQLLMVQGDAKSGAAVKFLTFEGLAFAHTNWTTPKEGSSIPQAAVTVNAEVQANFATNLTFDRCTFSQAGTYGLDLGVGCKDAAVERCQFLDLGTGGLKVGTQGLPASSAHLAERIKVADNTFAHLGRIHPAAVGVWIGQAADVSVDHNDIYDLYYTCISSGWVWGYGKTANRDIHITNNHLHHYGQSVLSDMGAIYTLGASPNSTIEGNRIHDCLRDAYGGWGIYYDEGSSGWMSQNNLLYRLHDGGFHQHYGAENVFVNNLLVNAKEVQWGPTRIDTPLTPGKAIPRTAITFERNVIVGWGAPSVVRGEALGALIQSHADLVKVRQNTYWNHGKPLKFGSLSLEEWQRRGFDQESVLADPKLPNDLEQPDFSVPADSPAVKQGFLPFTVASAGRTTKTAMDLDPRRWPQWFPPADHKPRPISESFEFIPVGSLPDAGRVVEQPPQATLRVTDEQAYSGKKSLKFVDAPKLNATYLPYLYWQPTWTAGVVTGKFAILNEGATLSHEWRGAGNPYQIGPSILLMPDGTLKASKKVLCKIEKGIWTLIEIRCPLGEQAGSYDVTVTPKGKEPKVFKDLKCGQDFREIRWFGFSAVGETGAAYIDDVGLDTK